MTVSHDIIGRRFGKLEVISLENTRGGRSYWLCKCDCGRQCVRQRQVITRSNLASCGCHKGGHANKGRRPASYTHGLSRTRLMRVWSNMKDRCGNPKNHRYADYGGRGVKVCKSWLDFSQFAAWALSHGYDDALQLDRIDNNFGYSPENCRFVTPSENMANMRRSIRYVVRGKEIGMAELERTYGILRHTFRYRVEVLGYSPDDAITCSPPKGGLAHKIKVDLVAAGKRRSIVR